jgi:uncharacterized membrane protein
MSAPPPSRVPANAILALLTLAYPFAVFFAVRRGQTLALLVMGALGVLLVLARFAGGLGRSADAPAVLPLWVSLVMPALLAVFAWVGHGANWPELPLLWPVLINLAFLWTFATSLGGTPMVERLARLQDPALNDEKIAYCRTVTKVWCGFFLLNAAVIATLAFLREVGLWTLYTGALSYVLMGLVFAVELAVRHARFGWDVSLASRLVVRLAALLRGKAAR